MIVAVNTRFLIKDRLEGYGYFTKEIVERVVRDHPEHQFYFLFDRAFDEAFVVASNVHPIVVSPKARLPILWKYWYDIKVPLVLKKIKADVFVSPDGFCSLTASVAQCLVLHDLGFLHYPETYKRSHVSFLKRNTPKFLKKAKTVITVSGFSKNDIIKNYRTPAEKIDVVYNGVRSIFRAVSVEEKKEIREKYTEGKEFFIYAGAIQPRKNLISLLKAFSIFKKRLQSNMKLVFTGRVEWKNGEFYQLLKTYKYREDVILTGYLPEEELSLLVGTAYALVYPSLFEGFGVPVIEAMKCRVPALTSRGSSMEEIAKGGALYFDAGNHADIADKMMLIYKDETLRNKLIENGEKIAEAYDWDKSAALFWQCILKTMDENQPVIH